MPIEPKLPPIVGLARVGMIRSKEKPRGQVADRLDWYDYVAKADLPTIIVLQDLDDTPGYGAWWGEVHSTVHKALGALGLRHQWVVSGHRCLGGGVPDHRRIGRAEPRLGASGRFRQAGERAWHERGA